MEVEMEMEKIYIHREKEEERAGEGGGENRACGLEAGCVLIYRGMGADY